MKVEYVIKYGIKIAVIYSETVLVYNVDTALDLLMPVKYGNDIERIVLNKSAIDERFFILSTGLAGEVLQKFVNYHIKLAVYGDFSKYKSKPLKDFIYESNHGSDLFFVETKEDAVEKLASVKVT